MDDTIANYSLMYRNCHPPEAKATRLGTTPPEEGFIRSPVDGALFFSRMVYRPAA